MAINDVQYGSMINQVQPPSSSFAKDSSSPVPQQLDQTDQIDQTDLINQVQPPSSSLANDSLAVDGYDAQPESQLSSSMSQLLDDALASACVDEFDLGLLSVTENDITFEVGMMIGNFVSASNDSLLTVSMAQTEQEMHPFPHAHETESHLLTNLNENQLSGSIIENLAGDPGRVSSEANVQLIVNSTVVSGTDEMLSSSTDGHSPAINGSGNVELENVPQPCPASDQIDNTMQSDSHIRKGRKRLRDESQWKRNIVKRLRNSGEEYTSQSGKTIPKRSVQRDCGNCLLKCSSKISAAERENIFNTYWKLGDKNYQNDFITSHVDILKATGKGRKNVIKVYHFTVEGQRIRVCKTFFLNTLNVSNKLIHYNTTKIRNEHGVNRLDQCGRQESQNKTKADKRQEVMDHINSFPCMDSHYCHSQSQRKYLEPSLNVQ